MVLRVITEGTTRRALYRPGLRHFIGLYCLKKNIKRNIKWSPVSTAHDGREELKACLCADLAIGQALLFQ